MKKWTNPKLITLNGKNTEEFDSSKGHACHQFDPIENCPDYTNGIHSYEYGRFQHTDPNWNDEHGHTCCCSDLNTDVPIS